MSVLFPYLRLSLRYIHGTKATTVFSYPSEERAIKPSFDIPAILTHFANLSEFYVIGCHDGQRYYSYISVDESVSTDRLELTLSTDSNILLQGRAILNFFNSVKDMIESEEPFTDITLSAALEASGFNKEPQRSATTYRGNDLTAKPCFRTYVSANELGTILTFPRQSAYATYSEVVLTHVTTVANPDDALPQITEPLTQAFTVVYPPGVTASAECVELTDHLALTYTRQGFEPTVIDFEVGTTNRYVKIAGPVLIVNNADKAGIVFVQRVAFEVISSKGNPIDTYTILVNDRTATRADGVFEVTSNDFNDNGKVNITVSSTNYFTSSLDFTAAELAANQPLVLVLVPEEIAVVVRLDFGDRRIIDQEILFEKKSAEYRQLRSGSFHGFRAHRLMNQEPETYRVDMTGGSVVAAMATSAPTVNDTARKAQQRTLADVYGENATAAEAEPQHQGAKTTLNIDTPKSAAELRAERLRRDIPQKPSEDKSEEGKNDERAEIAQDKTKSKPAVKKENGKRKAYAEDIPRKIDILEDDPDDDEPTGHHHSISPVILAAVAVVLITVVIVWYLFTLLPKADNDDNTDAVDLTEQMVNNPQQADRISVVDDTQAAMTQPSKAPEATTPAGPTAEETADVAYLNNNETWRLADLKSEKYRKFFALLGSGDIDAIANADYFAVKDQATNKKAIKVVEYLWEAKGTFAEKRNVNAMKALDGKDSININDLYETLARMQDAKPNKDARPQR